MMRKLKGYLKVHLKGYLKVYLKHKEKCRKEKYSGEKFRKEKYQSICARCRLLVFDFF